MLLAGGTNADWYLGLTLGFIIVTVVVILVAVILSYAARISDQTQLANEGLEEVRTGTAPLWEVRNTNKAGIAILGATRTAREAVVATVTGAPLPVAPPQPPPPPAAEQSGSQSGPTHPPGVLGPESYPNRGQGA
jgi:hypothetical protein